MEIINTMREAKRLNARYRVYGKQGRHYVAEHGAKVVRSLLIDKPTAVDLAATTDLNQFAYACKTALDDAYMSGMSTLVITRTDKPMAHRGQA